MKFNQFSPRVVDKPIRLLDKEVTNPLLVFQEIFEFYDLNHIRVQLSDWLELAFSSEDEDLRNPIPRVNLMQFALHMEKRIAGSAKAAAVIGARAPVRIDCRQDERGTYRIFDVNLKPNMTGPSRPHRFDQDSLVALAAADLGWNYNQLLVNMLRQRW